MNTGLKNQQCPQCGRFDNRGVSIDAIIIKNNKCLLVQRGVEPNKGYWGTHGGYVEWDESTEETVKREIKEETNLDVENIRLVMVSSAPTRHPRQVINIVNLVSVKDGELKFGDDTLDAKWFNLDSSPNPMALDHKYNIEESKRLVEVLK